MIAGPLPPGRPIVFDNGVAVPGRMTRATRDGRRHRGTLFRHVGYSQIHDQSDAATAGGSGEVLSSTERERGWLMS